ncbi:MAG: chromosome partitioning protein ParB [Micrococcales bacterium]|nr:chromosome partitioning protein ParB [Micrococcales bacterium]
MPIDTGSPRADAEADFLRVRRQEVMSRLGHRLRGRDGATLSLEEVVGALGQLGERTIGVHVIDLDKVVGSVDKVRDFDPAFRPTSGRSRTRWERIAEAVRRGQALPPIDVYQVGDQYFVRDGHHRVSVLRALGEKVVDADVTVIRTAIDTVPIADRGDLKAAQLRRLFLERVPLDRLAQRECVCQNPWHYPQLAEMVEAWAARLMFREHELLSVGHAAARWYAEEFAPVTQMLRDAGLIVPAEGDGDAYLRAAIDRYSLVRAHVWTREVFDELRKASKK